MKYAHFADSLVLQPAVFWLFLRALQLCNPTCMQQWRLVL